MTTFNRIKTLTIGSFFVFFLFQCDQPAPRHKEVKLVIEAEDYAVADQWETGKYYTGNSALTTKPWLDSNQLVFPVSIPVAGNYEIRALAAHRKYPVRSASLDLEMNGKRYKLPINTSRALVWSSAINAQLDSGDYELVVRAENSEGSLVYLDQLLITNRMGYQPQGYEYELDTSELILPPAWAFGVLYGGYTNQQESMDRVRRLIAEGYPIDAYWIDSWFWNYYNEGKGPDGYIDFRGDLQSYPSPKIMWDYFEENHIKGGIWVWNAIQDKGNEEAFEDFLNRDYFSGPPRRNSDGWHNKNSKDTRIADVDFKRPEVARYWTEQMKPFFEMGLDFVKLDRSSNVDYMKTVFQATQQLGKETKGRGFIMSHLHSTHDPAMLKYPTKWSGDAKIAWEQPDYPNMGSYSMGALKENIMMVADPNRSTYEVPFLANDLGGYNYFGSKEQSDSLYIRWAQFALLQPITTVFSTADSPNSNMPFHFSKQAQQVFKYYAELKHRLFPYIYSYVHLTRAEGVKPVRGDGVHPLQYHLGKELLIAPVLRESHKKIFFPEGDWFDFYTDDRIAGGGYREVKTNLDRIPIYVKAGSIIPMRAPTQQIETASNDQLTLHVYPGTVSSFVLTEDDGVSNSYLNGQIARTKMNTTETSEELTLQVAPVIGGYEGLASSRSFQIVLHDWNQVEVEQVVDLKYDKAGRTLSFGIHNVPLNEGFTITVTKK